MQIRQVDVFRLKGVLEHPEPFWDDVADSDYPLRVGSGQYRVAAAFVAVLSDAGLTGLGVALDQARIHRRSSIATSAR